MATVLQSNLLKNPTGGAVFGNDLPEDYLPSKISRFGRSGDIKVVRLCIWLPNPMTPSHQPPLPLTPIFTTPL